MIFNYLKLSLRLLLRNPFFTFINVLGLSVGFAAFLILWQYSQHELKSDQFHQDWERIARIGTIGKWTDDKVNWQEATVGFSHPELCAKIAAEYSEVADFTRILVQKNFYKKFTLDHDRDISFAVKDKSGESHIFLESNIIYADPNFFDFFKIDLVKGSSQSVLNQPNTVVLSEKTAQKYFGEIDPINKIIILNNTISLKVTGVFKNLPMNTHLSFDIAISSQRLKAMVDIDITFQMFTCYLKLQKGTSLDKLQPKINQQSKDDIQRSVWGSWTFGKSEIFLQPLADMPFTTYSDYYQPKSKYLLFIFGASSLVILVMAWINYVNLTISSNRKRMKEIGARKTVGARSIDFIIQFWTEALVINALSIMFALTIVQLIKFPAAIFLNFYILDWNEISPSTIIIALGATVTGILVTGLYPATVILNQTTRSLFGSFRLAGRISKGLTVFQFAVAIVLIIWIFSLYLQLHYIITKNIGLDRADVLIVDVPINKTSNFKSDLNYFIKEITRNHNIKGYALSQSVPGDLGELFSDITKNVKGPGIGLFSNGGVDEHFIPFYGIELVAGRNFLPDNPADSASVILSKLGLHRLGFKSPEDALGQNVIVDSKKNATVIGIINDYKIRPLLRVGVPDHGLMLTYSDYIYAQTIPKKISIRINPAHFRVALDAIGTTYRSVFSDNVFNWYFLDELINSHYQNHEIALNQIMFFTFIAIVVACLGLLGMITNKVVEKTKEVGIRKVFGARMKDIAQMLLNETIWQVALATIIGIPSAYYLTQRYLEVFSERITLQWWHYTIPVVLLFAIMFATITTVLLRAATTSPVESLRYE